MGFSSMTSMMDTKKGEAQQAPAPSTFRKFKTMANPKRLFMGVFFFVCILTVMFGMGILSAKRVELDLETHGKAEAVEGTADDYSDALVHRRDGNNDDGVLVPISTQTTLTTIYSISQKPIVAVETATVTGTTFITIRPEPEASTWTSLITTESSSEICTAEVVTMTRSVTITVLSSEDSPEDATVTGNPSTITDFLTDLSFSNTLPDATVSGNPDTVTDIQIDWSVSSGLPDATVSGDPSTITEHQTDFSISSGLPDATVSGSPETITDLQASYSVSGSIWTVITITDLFPPQHTLSTVTEYATVHKTITTLVSSLIVVTVSELYPASPSAQSEETSSEAAGEAITVASPTSTFTKVVTETQGDALTLTTTVQVVGPPPYPSANNTVAGVSGTIAIHPSPSTSAIVISGGSKKPEPRGWTGPNGSSSLGCTIMIIAVTMLML